VSEALSSQAAHECSDALADSIQHHLSRPQRHKSATGREEAEGTWGGSRSSGGGGGAGEEGS
jgi:hypothetical protein